MNQALTQVSDQQRQPQRGKEEDQRLYRHKGGPAHCAAAGLEDQVSDGSSGWEVIDDVCCNLNQAHRGAGHLRAGMAVLG